LILKVPRQEQQLLASAGKEGGNLIDVYKCLKGGCKGDRARLSSVVPSDRTRGNGHKVKHGRFLLNVT